MCLNCAITRQMRSEWSLSMEPILWSELWRHIIKFIFQYLINEKSYTVHTALLKIVKFVMNFNFPPPFIYDRISLCSFYFCVRYRLRPLVQLKDGLNSKTTSEESLHSGCTFRRPRQWSVGGNCTLSSSFVRVAFTLRSSWEHTDDIIDRGWKIPHHMNTSNSVA